MKTISAADANRRFSSLLRAAKAGETIVVTSRGKPVARIEPAAGMDDETARKDVAWEALLDRLDAQPSLGIPVAWTRDDIYDDDF